MKFQKIANEKHLQIWVFLNQRVQYSKVVLRDP